MTRDKATLRISPWVPAGAGTACWIVCEQRGDWAVALRREAQSAGLRIHEIRSLTECRQMLRGHPASFLVLELTSDNVEAVLGCLVRLGREFPLARAAVVARRCLAACEWLVREAGAVWFTASPREVGPIAAIARRHLDAAPAPSRSLADEIWAGLPWGRGE